MLQKSWLRKGKTIIATRTRQWQHDEKGQRRERKKRTMRSRTNPLLLNWIGYYRFSLVSIDRRSYRYEFINNAETEEKVPLMDLRMNLRTDNAPRNWRIMRGLSESSIRASSAERSFVSIPSQKNSDIFRRAPLITRMTKLRGKKLLILMKDRLLKATLISKAEHEYFRMKIYFTRIKHVPDDEKPHKNERAYYPFENPEDGRRKKLF